MNHLLNHLSNTVKKIRDSHHFKPKVVGVSVCLVVVIITGILSVRVWFLKEGGSRSYNVQIAAVDQAQIQPQLLVQPQSKPQDTVIIASQVGTVPASGDANGKTFVAAPASGDANGKTFVAAIRAKDNLIKVFKRNGINTKSAQAILALKRAKSLRELRTSKKLSLTVDVTDKTKLKQLVYVVDDLNTLTVDAKGNSWYAQIKHIEPTVTVKYASATINGSVYTAASKNGIPRKIVAQLANVFSKKADFKKMQKGDRLAIFYKEYTANGKKIKDGEIVAAELLHKKRLYRMIGFADAKGNINYYTPDGYNSRPPLLRYPVPNYERVGSVFSYNRLHPILHFTRPHLGVDFVAKTGTPIRAACGGKVEFVGTNGGHGRAVVIRRGSYKTLYAHLSKFSNDVRLGGNVNQGQIIGYVGHSGLATGSHLHYELHVNGVPRDPLKVKLPDGEMIAPEHRKKFFALSRRMIAQLDLHGNHKMLALNEVTDSDPKESQT